MPRAEDRVGVAVDHDLDEPVRFAVFDRAADARHGQIQRVFLVEGALLAFVGSLVGSAMGGGAAIYWHAVERQPNGAELFPLILERELFVYTAILATLTALLAAVAPALRAALLDPVEAIRA